MTTTRTTVPMVHFGGVAVQCARPECEVKPAGGFRKCGGCRRVYYCSASCQKSDWSFHKSMCKLIQKDPAFVRNCPSDTAARATILEAERALYGALPASQRIHWCSLMDGTMQGGVAYLWSRTIDENVYGMQAFTTYVRTGWKNATFFNMDAPENGPYEHFLLTYDEAKRIKDPVVLDHIRSYNPENSFLILFYMLNESGDRIHLAPHIGSAAILVKSAKASVPLLRNLRALDGRYDPTLVSFDDVEDMPTSNLSNGGR